VGHIFLAPSVVCSFSCFGLRYSALGLVDQKKAKPDHADDAAIELALDATEKGAVTFPSSASIV
jgi:hypothetical protein